MLSIGKLAVGQERYYEKQVAQGLDDYFSGRGESPGRWFGRGAAALGLGGVVVDGELSMLMTGLDPRSGQELREQSVKVAALDLTFSAPKSVSVLHALASEGVSQEIVRCHEEAVAAALGYLEDTAVWVSRRVDGMLRLEPGGGFVAAAFRHRMSRALDPQLHTHCVAGNLARGPDGRWTALHHPTLFRAAKTAGYMYQAHLRALVAERLGLEWGEVRKGAAELVAIPAGVLGEFSRRRHEMERAAEASGVGLGSRAASQAAALASRSRKQYGIETGTWHEEVAARAAEHGLDHRAIEALERSWSARSALLAEQRCDGESEAVIFERLAGPTGMTEMQNTFDEAAVLRALAAESQQGSRVGELRERATRFAARDDVHETASGGLTTAELLAVERRLIAAAVGRAGEGTGRVGAEPAERVLENHGLQLNAGQRQAVLATVGSGHGVQVVEALAGTGKTYIAGALRLVYEASGYEVVGIGPTGRAVRELSENAGIPSRTLDSLTSSLQRGYTLPKGGVIVLDEAGMAPTRHTAVLLEAAQAAGCKVIAIGDPGQLASVQAGGWMRAVGQRVGTVRLSEVMRQRDPAERRALAALHEGQPHAWLEWARAHARVALGTGQQQLDRAVSDWYATVVDRGHAGAVLIARGNETRAALNRRARALMLENGRLGEQRSYGPVEVAVGDRVICRRNDYEIDVDNGTRATVRGVTRDQIVIETASGRWRHLPGAYVGAHVEHAYALTGHGIQGGTVDSAFVVAAPHELTKGWSYTALSRARAETRLYVVTDADARLRQEMAPGERREDKTERAVFACIDRYLRTRDDEDLAIDQLQAVQPRETAGPLGASRADGGSLDTSTLVQRHAGVLGKTRARQLEALVARQVVDTKAASVERLEQLAAREPEVLATLDRGVAGQALRCERELANHMSVAEKLAGDAEALRHRAADLGWRRRRERRSLEHDAELRHEHSCRHRGDAERLRYELARLSEAGVHPDQWLARNGEILARIIAARAELGSRREAEIDRASLLAAIDTPGHVHQLLGERPGTGEPLETTWVDVAARVERFRLKYGIDVDHDGGLGPDPVDLPSPMRDAYSRDRLDLADAVADYRAAVEIDEREPVCLDLPRQTGAQGIARDVPVTELEI